MLHQPPAGKRVQNGAPPSGAEGSIRPTGAEALDAMLSHVHAAWWEERTRQPKEHGVFERDGWRCLVFDLPTGRYRAGDMRITS